MVTAAALKRQDVAPREVGIASGELDLETIKFSVETGKAVVHFRLDDTRSRIEVQGDCLQSFPKFQAAAFRAAGVWPRCTWAQDGRAAACAEYWRALVDAAIAAGREGAAS